MKCPDCGQFLPPGFRRCGGCDYVYTLDAVKARFKRGHKKVGLFIPNTGTILTVTPKTFKRAQRAFQKGASQ